MNKIGYMQGRLSPSDNGKIQEFPWKYWDLEFATGNQCGFDIFEWTLDRERLYENPIMTIDGQEKIIGLCKKFNMTIPSLTADCFMQAPFWKSDKENIHKLQNEFIDVVRACSMVSVNHIVVPLVDNGSVESRDQEDYLIGYLNDLSDLFRDMRVNIIFESDYPPKQLEEFMGRLPMDCFGINYDMGNSAAMGYDPRDEFSAYGNRIKNIHVKDRLLGGQTVPLGAGNVDFDKVFSLFIGIKYKGNLILQTARANDSDHVTPIVKYKNLVTHYINKYEFRSK